METKTKIFGQHDDATIKQIETCVAAGGDRGVLCADGHKGYAQPIGGVVAYENKISLSGVGFDIACGNLAILTDAKREENRAEDRQDHGRRRSRNFVWDRPQKENARGSSVVR
jgi:RNA-splicing ligase RtcB